MLSFLSFAQQGQDSLYPQVLVFLHKRGVFSNSHSSPLDVTGVPTAAAAKHKACSDDSLTALCEFKSWLVDFVGKSRTSWRAVT